MFNATNIQKYFDNMNIIHNLQKRNKSKMKGSTKFWLVVAGFALIALVQFVIVPNWGNTGIKIGVFFVTLFYLILTLLIGIDPITKNDEKFLQYSPIGLLIFFVKQINKLADKYLK